MFFIYYITQQLNYPNMKTGVVLLTLISCEIEFIYIIIPLCVNGNKTLLHRVVKLVLSFVKLAALGGKLTEISKNNSYKAIWWLRQIALSLYWSLDYTIYPGHPAGVFWSPNQAIHGNVFCNFKMVNKLTFLNYFSYVYTCAYWSQVHFRV